MGGMNWAGRFGMALAAAVLGGAAFAAPAMAQTNEMIYFTGSDGLGGTLRGSALVTGEGAGLSVLDFSATFDNLAQEGAPVNSVTFGLTDVLDAYWFTAADPSGLGVETFSFDLSGIQSDLTAVSSYYDMVYLFGTTSGFGSNFITTVTESDVPEPASLAMLALGLAGLAATRRRRA